MDLKIELLNTHFRNFARDGGINACLDLLKQGAQVNGKSPKNGGDTALHCAAYWGHAACCVMLLDHGADALIKNGAQLTAADVAIWGGHRETVTVLRAWVARNSARAALGEFVTVKRAPDA